VRVPPSAHLSVQFYTNGVPVAQVKAAATSYGQPPVQQLESTHISGQPTESADGNLTQSDPTITHAGLTEMGDI
jgi:hypothetical protein